MALSPLNTETQGRFREVENDTYFDFSVPLHEPVFGPEFDVIVWVNGGSYRWAKVLKTVAYIVVDENPDGSPVVEKWKIKQYKKY